MPINLLYFSEISQKKEKLNGIDQKNLILIIFDEHQCKKNIYSKLISINEITSKV